uniref:Beta-adaptin appendage C-terminal subdomain domain-containing protein n=1 Tax=Lotharella oceanica TaxID=641309 RepID=A0A7S2XBG6_9EUKA|mmetsp:Transcript_24329/g.45532  ORF Transcript_24329/g.45532 Transcript_24329/m.45532 type:complete len:339 (+) Transcript_24329:73-1089(+)
MGNCCQLLFGGGKKYEKVTAQEGKATDLELQPADDVSTSRKERASSNEGIKDIALEGKSRKTTKISQGKAPTLAPPPEDLARLKEELREKLRLFFLVHNPSQANRKSLDHIVAFYTSFDDITSLNNRLRDKYGEDLTSVQPLTTGTQSNGYSPPSPPKSPVQPNSIAPVASSTAADPGPYGNQNGQVGNGDEAKGTSGAVNDGIQAEETAGGRDRASSALQRAAMFEQTWGSDIPSTSVALNTKIGQPGINSINALTSALGAAQCTLVASGEVDNTIKAYFYTIGEAKGAIVLVELVADMDPVTKEIKEYRLLCKFNDRSCLDAALARIAAALNAQRA